MKVTTIRKPDANGENAIYRVVPQAVTGEQAYEADRAALPLYHNGTPRPCWADLPDYAQWSWNRNPTVPARRVVA